MENIKSLKVFSKKIDEVIDAIFVNEKLATATVNAYWSDGGWNNSGGINWLDNGWNNFIGSSWMDKGWNNFIGSSWTDNGWNNFIGSSWMDNGWSNSW